MSTQSAGLTFPPSFSAMRRISGERVFEEPCWLMAGSGYLEFSPLETTVGELDGAVIRADSAVSVLLPARTC